MGKEWYWSGKSSKRSSSSHVLVDRDTNSNSTKSTITNSTTTSVGCMCAVFQLFDFNHFQFASNLQNHETQPSFKSISTRNTSISTFELPEEHNIPKGAEAPRNSLKSEEGTSLSSIMEDEEVQLENFNNIQMGISQIKTSCGNGGNYGSSSKSSAKSISGLSPATDFFSDTSSNSPGTKTPSLVARLMGLDLLPESTNSPNYNFTSPTTTTNKYQLNHSKSHSHTNPLKPRTIQTLQNKARHLMDLSENNSGTRSLPETPRISSARRSDVDIHHHRLSLQINKENVGVSTDDLDFSRLSYLRRKYSKPDHHNQEYYETCSSTTSSSTKSRGYDARQIVKQVKESVTRKAGLDITNTLREYDFNNNKNSHVKPKRSPKTSKGLSRLEEQASTTSTNRGNNQNKLMNTNVNNSSTILSSSSLSSCSPRLKPSLLSSSSTSNNKDQSFQVSKPTLLSSSLLTCPSLASTVVKAKPTKQEQQEKGKRNKSSSGDGNMRRMKVQKIMQEETFVFGRSTKKTDQTSYKRANINIPDKIKCKTKTPLSNNLLNINVVTTLLAVKKTTKDDIAIHDHLKPQKIQPGAEIPLAPSDDAQESKRIIISTSHSSSSQSHNNNIKNCHVSDSLKTPSTKNDAVALRHYITKVLFRTGISLNSHVSLANWFSPSHPLDPSIFHRLELHYSDDIHRSNSSRFYLLGPRCNRKLAFDVVDELLAEILRPCMNLKPWITSNAVTRPRSLGTQGKDLIETLCSRVDGFACKDCQVLEDIDALIDQDLCDDNQMIKSWMGIGFEEEGEALVMEIEKDLVDTLVHETALSLIAN